MPNYKVAVFVSNEPSGLHERIAMWLASQPIKEGSISMQFSEMAIVDASILPPRIMKEYTVVILYIPEVLDVLSNVISSEPL